MEIKPADKEIIDHKDLRYKRKVSNKGIKDMDKQAYEHTVGLVLSKTAAPNLKPLFSWLSSNIKRLRKGNISPGTAASGNKRSLLLNSISDKVDELPVHFNITNTVNQALGRGLFSQNPKVRKSYLDFTGSRFNAGKDTKQVFKKILRTI